MPIRSRPSPDDPLLYDFPLPFRAEYFPMGFAVDIATNSSAVLDYAAGIWSTDKRLSQEPAVQIRFGIVAGGEEEPPPVLPRGHANLVSIVHSAANFAVADLARGSAFAWLTESVVANAGYFRDYFLEPLAYLMLTSLYLSPIHAACVELNGAGILLCGDSGAGKTSLAYACARRGWVYISGDASYLVRESVARQVIGRPAHIRFRESAKLLFPELAQFPLNVHRNGKSGMEISTSRLGLSTAFYSQIESIVFLDRKSLGAPRLRNVDQQEARAWFEAVITYGEECVRAAQRKSFGRLLTLPIAELCYRDLADAESLLRSLALRESA